MRDLQKCRSVVKTGNSMVEVLYRPSMIVVDSWVDALIGPLIGRFRDLYIH